MSLSLKMGEAIHWRGSQHLKGKEEMARDNVTKEIAKEALKNPTQAISALLTVVFDADDYVQRVDIERNSALSDRQITSVFAGITRRLRKHSNQEVSSGDLFDIHDCKGFRLRSDLRAVVGEVLGREEGGLREPTTPVGSVGVEIHGVTLGGGLVNVEFRLTGLQAHEQAVFVSIPVRPHGRKIPELVDEATALFRKKAELLAKALAGLDLSRWH